MKTAMIVLLLLVGVVIAGALFAGPSLQNALSKFKPEPVTTKVRVEAVKPTKLTEIVKAPGKIEPHTKVDISAEVSARIEALPYEVGNVVTKGAVVVKLDDRDLKASLDSADARAAGEQSRLQAEQARLTGLISSLSFARKQLERQQALSDSGDISARDLDTAMERSEDLAAQVEATKFSISTIESSLAAAKADIDQVKQNLEKTIIRSPMDGVLTARNAEIGEVVLLGTMNNPGTVILTIANLSRMLVKAEVAETDIAKIAMGQSAKVHINAYRDDVFSGTVTLIALQRTENELNGTGYFEAEVEIDLRGKEIRSGGLANVDIEIAAHGGLAVESQAIVDRVIDDLPEEVKQDNPLVDRSKRTCTVVYCMTEGKAVCTAVKRGASDDTHSQVLEGLKEGDVVVVGPFKVLEQIKHGELLSIDDGKKEGDRTATESDEGGGVRVRVR